VREGRYSSCIGCIFKVSPFLDTLPFCDECAPLLPSRPHVAVMAHALVALTQRSCSAAHLASLRQLYHQDRWVRLFTPVAMVTKPAVVSVGMLECVGTMYCIHYKWW